MGPGASLESVPLAALIITNLSVLFIEYIFWGPRCNLGVALSLGGVEL